MPQVSHKRIAKNTLMLYFRMLMATGVALYTVRVVLNTLGVEDYGTYHAVAGLVVLCAFLPSTLASATQRFFSFALGENDNEQLKKTFIVNLVLYAAISFIAIIVLETIGLWFVKEQLRIPPDRFEAAKNLYHLSVLTFTASIFTSPFNAIIIAHEDMHLYAYISISDALMKLGSVFLLSHLSWDKLELYGLLLLIISIINTTIYIAICIRKYDECQFRKFYWDAVLLRTIVGFTGWTMFGQLSTIARTHAVTLLLNQTFNPTVIAARAIAVNVATQINIFSSNFNTSLYPPIIKSWATNNKEEMYSLVFNGSKFSFFLMWILALPLFIQMEAVLTLWLKDLPTHVVLFTRLAMLEALILSISLPLATAARAPGQMRFYELTLGTMQLAIFFISWLVLKQGMPPHSVFLVAIAVNVLMFIARLGIVHTLTGIPMKGYLHKVMIPSMGVAFLSSIMSFGIVWLFPSGWVFTVASIALSALFTAVCIYFIGLDRYWRKIISTKIAAKFKARLSV